MESDLSSLPLSFMGHVHPHTHGICLVSVLYLKYSMDRWRACEWSHIAIISKTSIKGFPDWLSEYLDVPVNTGHLGQIRHINTSAFLKGCVAVSIELMVIICDKTHNFGPRYT